MNAIIPKSSKSIEFSDFFDSKKKPLQYTACTAFYLYNELEYFMYNYIKLDFDNCLHEHQYKIPKNDTPPVNNKTVHCMTLSYGYTNFTGYGKTISESNYIRKIFSMVADMKEKNPQVVHGYINSLMKKYRIASANSFSSITQESISP